MGKLNVVAEPGKHEIRISRDFDAPRELVFRAHSDPALVARWWGLKSTTTVVDKMEAKAGGLWRYVERDAEGNEYGFHGVYHEVTAPERIVYTFEFEGMPGHVAMSTLTFEAVDGKTRLLESSIYQSVEDRDGMIQSGMETGAAESWDSLEEILKTL